MEKQNAKMKNLFTTLISNVSKAYKECSNSNNEAYLKGKKEAFEEMLNWFVTSHNGELKYISATSFFNMIQEKLAKTKTALNLVKADDAEEEISIKPAMNFAEIKISDNRKRINRWAAAEREGTSGISLNTITSYNPFNEEDNFGGSNTNSNNINSNNPINNSSSSNPNINSLNPNSFSNSNLSFPFSINSLNEQRTKANIDTEMASVSPVSFSAPFQNNNIHNNLGIFAGSNLQPVLNTQGTKKKRK